MANGTPKMRERPTVNSAIWIARMLDTEGFTEHVGAQVRRYQRRKSLNTERSAIRREKLKRAFGETMRKVSDADRFVIGKFMALLQAEAFDAGLRIGLTVQMFPEEKVLEMPAAPARR